MSGFSVDWLDLREPADHRARDPELAEAAVAALEEATDPLVVDLGSGAGSTLRALGPLMPRPVRWRLVDHDADLLAIAAARAGAGGGIVSPGEAGAAGVLSVETVVQDLAAMLPLPVAGAGLVTASALIDLVSRTFIERLVASAASHRAVIYMALAYDGTMAWEPAHPMDAPIVAAFNRDQVRDKGFGPALGPSAAEVLVSVMQRAGYDVRTAASPWRLGPDDHALAAALATGIAAAVADAFEDAPGLGARGSDARGLDAPGLDAPGLGARGLDAPGSDARGLDDWLATRLATPASVTVGHLDVLGAPG